MKYWIGCVVLLAILLGVCKFQYDQNKRLKAANDYLTDENAMLVALAPDTIRDTTLHRVTVPFPYRVVRRDTVRMWVDTLFISRVVLADTVRDSLVDVFYQADIYGNLNDLQLGYRLKVPKIVNVPYPVDRIVEVERSRKWGVSALATGYAANVSAGILVQSPGKLGAGLQYSIRDKWGVTVAYRIR